MKRAMDKNLLSPLSVALVGAMVGGRVNYLVIGYICPFNFAKHIFFSLYKKRHTRQGIVENMTFSVNIPSSDLHRELEICGSKSGRDMDKATLFTNFFGELGTAPMIAECPINIECKVDQIIDYDPCEGIIGRVVKSYVSEECLVDGELDIRRANPLVWATTDSRYYRLGEPLGEEPA